MGLGFADLFIPDTQAAVVGAKGANDILEGQYKQPMGFLEMENALLKAKAMKDQAEKQKAEEPLQKTVEAIKLLQGLNVVGGDPFSGVNPQDPNSLNDALLRTINSGQLKTTPEVELMKTQAQTQASMAAKEMLESGRNARDAADRVAEAQKEADKQANAFLKDLRDKYPKTPNPSTPAGERKARALVADYSALVAYKSKPAALAFYRQHAELLSAAGVPPPDGAVRSSPAKKEAPKTPPTIVIKGRTFQKVNGKIVEVKGG